MFYQNKKNEDINDWLLQFSQSVSQCSFRIFICNEDGFQQSGNVMKKRWRMDCDAGLLYEELELAPVFSREYHENAF